jgi:hypothetical protein
MINITACPSGFVIPEHPDNAYVIYANRSATECAFSCVSHPRYTPEEYSTLFAIRLWSNIFSGFVAFIAVNVWTMDHLRLKNHFFVVLYCIIMIVGSFAMALAFAPGRAERFCEDNATPIYEHPTDACTSEGFFMFVSLEMMIFCWCFQSIELFRSVVLGHQKGNPWSLLPWIVVLPIFLGCMLIIKGSFVYELGKINCDLWSKNPEEEFLFAWLPTMVAVFVGFICSQAVAIRIAFLYRSKSRANDGNSNLWNVLKIFSTALKYLFGFGVYLGSIMLVAIASGNSADSASDVDLDLKWAACVFSLYDGVSDESFLAKCGRTPERNVHFLTLCFFQFYTFAMHGIFFMAVYWKQMSNIYLKVCHPQVYYRKIAPDNIGELPVSASSAISDDPGSGALSPAKVAPALEVIKDGSRDIVSGATSDTPGNSVLGAPLVAPTSPAVRL